MSGVSSTPTIMGIFSLDFSKLELRANCPRIELYPNNRPHLVED